VFAGLFCHQSYPAHYFLLFTVLVSLSLVNSKGWYHDCLRKIVVGMSLSLSKIAVSQSSETSEYVSTYNWDKIQLSYMTLLLQSPDVNWRKYDKLERISESVVTWLQSYSSKNWGSGRVYVFVTWDPYILLQAVSKLEVVREPEQLTNARIRWCVWKC
jgi:hypothetical protein